jgi:hypothetical protein
MHHQLVCNDSVEVIMIVTKFLLLLILFCIVKLKQLNSEHQFSLS